MPKPKAKLENWKVGKLENEFTSVRRLALGVRRLALSLAVYLFL
jgi:hypothetical protein